jgi:hypothetical protein
MMRKIIGNSIGLDLHKAKFHNIWICMHYMW